MQMTKTLEIMRWLSQQVSEAKIIVIACVALC